MSTATFTSRFTLNRPDLLISRNIIGNEQKPSLTDRTFAVLNPADGSVLENVPDSGARDGAAAADAALTAYADWKARTGKERSNILRAWFQLLMKNQEDLATLISAEVGKPLAESRGEVAYAASFVEWYAEEAKRTYGDVIPETLRGRRLFAVKEPVGVVALVTPWNFPVAMITRKAAPALAAGCTVVVKPAEDTPLSALATAQLAIEAGLPAGAINIVTASRPHAPEVVDQWLKDFRVRKISFTGSTPVGKHLMRESAETLKRISLELGGNAPFIVFDDADLDAAVSGAMICKFRNTGQTCVCANRLFVQAGIYDAFAAKLKSAVEALTVGNALEGPFDLGPLINMRGIVKVEEHVSDAKAKGAKVITGGHRHSLGGCFYEPTVVTGATVEMKFAQEETFGPVAPLFKFETEADVVRLANSTRYGLAAYFYSRDIGRVWRVAGALEFGILGVNEGIISTEVAPFGGVKESGIGREGGRQGIEEFLSTKYICMGGLA
jgi:succinate-semialdehyde dehydrogenase/glutarate-semialdehyde dehydrogenase